MFMIARLTICVSSVCLLFSLKAFFFSSFQIENPQNCICQKSKKNNHLFRNDLECVKKEVRELTVEEAVAKNAFEKASRSGNEKVNL